MSESLIIEWSRIYTIFDNDDLSSIDHDQLAFLQIRNSQLHCVGARPPFMPYIDVFMWALDHVDPKERIFRDIHNVVTASFHPKIFARAYALPTPKKLLYLKFIKEIHAKFNYEQVVKSWLQDPMLDIPVSLPVYPISWFREPFSLLCTMICRLYGLPNCSSFQAKWVHLANHILLIGHSFNWAQILSYNLRVEIEKYERTPDKRKPSFYMLGFVMDAFCASTAF